MKEVKSEKKRDNKFVRIYKPNGEVEDVAKCISFTKLQEIVDGFVGVLNLDSGLTVAYNDDGLLYNLPRSIACALMGQVVNFRGNIVVGEFNAKGMNPVSSMKLERFNNTIIEHL